jgi:biopolymer transport protein ExbD
MAITPLAREDNSDIVAEINITPLTDIFLVLLIIFMITSSAIVESGGRVNLPSAVKTQSEPRGATVTITPNREIYVNQKKVTEANLENSLREVLNTSPDKIVILRGDRDVLLGQVVKVLSIVKKAGASEIAIAAEAEKTGP